MIQPLIGEVLLGEDGTENIEIFCVPRSPPSCRRCYLVSFSDSRINGLSLASLDGRLSDKMAPACEAHF